jgi:ketosteroid isomerase-like protein
MSRKLLSGVIVFLIMNTIVVGQTKDEKDIADVVEQLRTAMVNGDKAVLEKLTADKLSYGHSGGHIDDKKEFVEKLTTGASDFVTIDLSEQTIGISDKVAIVRHTFNAKTNDGGKPGEAHLKVLLIWQKQKGGWKLLARQAIKITQ